MAKAFIGISDTGIYPKCWMYMIWTVPLLRQSQALMPYQLQKGVEILLYS